MRVDLVDPPAYSPPYDDALASALARLGASVRLLTSHFAYGEPPRPDGYERVERFYRHAVGPAGSPGRAASKRAEHLIDMLRYRATTADVVHYQWLTVPRLDLRLLPPRPTVLTIHDPLVRSRWPHRQPLPAGAFARVDAIVVHSEYARTRVLSDHGLDPDRVHVIRHGAFNKGVADAPMGCLRDTDLPEELEDDGSPVVLSYGLIRPYKGTETLLEAWRGIDDAQLWVVGRPVMDISGPLAAAPAGARLVPRFVTPEQQHALFRRADIVVLPYERSQRFGFSGVLATALGYGKAIVLSDVGGLGEVAALDAARLVPPGDPQALHDTLAELIADADRVTVWLGRRAGRRQREFSWDVAARATLELYETIAAR